MSPTATHDTSRLQPLVEAMKDTLGPNADLLAILGGKAAPLEPLPADPTPEQIDAAIWDVELAELYHKRTKERLDAVRERLVAAVELNGSPVPRAEKSKRLEGAHNTATITYGTTVDVNTNAVQAFLAYLNGKRLAKLFPRFFAESTKYQLVEGAGDVLKTLEVPTRVGQQILSLFGRCIDVKDKKPSLKIAIVKPTKPAKSPRAKKGGK